jgi:hypothetical protein
MERDRKTSAALEVTNKLNGIREHFSFFRLFIKKPKKMRENTKAIA